MAHVVIGGTGRGEDSFDDSSGGFISVIRARVTGLPDIAASASFLRNPTWYTLGHLSLRFQTGQLLWEAFLNYEDQIWATGDLFFVTDFNNQLDLPPFEQDPNIGFIYPLTFAWQMRGNLSLDVWIGT